MESIIQKTLKLLLDKYGADYDVVTVSEENGQYRANIETSNKARIIGKNGDTLNAIQLLLKNILYRKSKENIFLSVDVDNYRKRQEDKIIDKVKHFIELMKENNLGEIKLPPMSAYFRRVVHMWILHNSIELASDSVGKGRDRAVRIFYK